MVERDEIIRNNPIESVARKYGVELKPHGKELRGLCPIHKEKTPSFYINPEKGVFKCYGCNAGGSVVDLVSKVEGISIADALAKLGGGKGRQEVKSAPTPKPEPKTATSERPVIEKIYEYQDEAGRPVYEVVRLNPKSFRQRHRGPDGKWVWNMDGVKRVLYRLPKVLKSKVVWIVEGEKDADNLNKFYTATCNVGGAGKWMDGYTESLRGKEIVICGDNDEPGRKHVEVVLKSLAGKVKSVRLVKVPEPHKDISDYIESFPSEWSEEDKARAIFKLVEDVPALRGGIDSPIKTIEDLEVDYRKSLRESEESSLNLGMWLPSLGKVRPLIGGELVTIIADTGVGKTMILQNIAVNCPVKTILFEQELPGELTFERFVAIATRSESEEIHNVYKSGKAVNWQDTYRLNHISVCCEPSLSPERLEQLIVESELVIGEKPKVVLLDYIGLMSGRGKSRYERMSNVAEQLKTIAKRTRTVIVVASQRSRPSDEENPEVFLHDAKDSGSIENSSGLVLGAWRDTEAADLLHLRVLKNTKGKSGFTVTCNIDGRTLTITERAFDHE